VFYEGEDNPPTFEDNQIILHKNGWYNIRQDSEVDDKLLTATSDVDTLDINFENDINFIPTTKDAPISFSNDNCNFKLSGKKLSTYSNDPTITVASCLNSQMPGIRVQPNQTLTLAGAGTFVVTAGNIDANL
jgi:hypothetical protein